MNQVASLWRRFLHSLGDGWYIPGDPQSPDRRRLVLCNYTSSMVGNLINGSFWTGLLLYMNADDAFIGTVTMITTGANMLQILSPMLMERFKQRKKLMIAIRAIVYLINVLVIGLIPLLPAAKQTRLTLTALCVLVANVLSALNFPGLSIWHIQSVPERVRKAYYALVSWTSSVLAALEVVLASRLVDLFRSAQMEYTGLLILRLVALVFCAIELWLYTRIKEYPYEQSGEKITPAELITRPLRSPLYRLTIAVAVLWGFSSTLPGSYYSVYMLKDIGVSYTYLYVINMMNIPVVILTTPIWRRILQKYDWFKTMYGSMAVYCLRYIALAFNTAATPWLYPLEELFCFITAIGINLVIANLAYVNMPAARQTAFMGFYSTCYYLSTLLGVTCSKHFILATDGITINLLGVTMINKQYLMLLTTCVMALATVGIYFIDRKSRALKAARQP